MLWFCFLSTASPALAGHDDETVLILHSYHPTLSWTAGIMNAMQERLAADRSNLILHVEYLDTKRNPGQEYFTSYVEGVLPQKLASLNLNLILTSDNDAFNFVRRHRSDLFKDVPVVFCGVNGFVPEMITNLGGITGVAEAPSFLETIEVALKLHPGTREVIFIGETLTETGRQNDVALHQLTDRLPAGLNIQFWNDRPLEELEPTLARLEQGQIVLLASIISKRSGEVLSFQESARHASKHSSVPIYGLWDFFLGEGIVGGHLTSSRAQGELAAGLALRILAGESADAIPVTTSDSNRYLFDANQLQRFAIAPDRLPTNSLIINRPPSFYHLDKWQLWAGVVIILSLSLSLFLLMRIMFLRRKAETSLVERARLAALGAEIGRVLTKGGALRETLQSCTEILIRQTGTAFGRLWIVSELDSSLMELQASAGLYTRTDGMHSIKRIGESKVGIIASKRQPILTNQVVGDPLFIDQEWVRREGIAGFAGYPLVVKGRLVGVVAFFSKQPLNEAVQASIASVADMIAVGIERHRAEVALQLALQETEESRDNIDAILRSVVDGLIVTDLENRVILINPSAEQFLGVTFKTAYCQPVETALQGKPFSGQISQWLIGQNEDVNLEITVPDQEGGKPLMIQVSKSPVYRRDGSAGGTVAILRDVTREWELDQLKSEFVASAAHELRTPLTTILGYAELLFDDEVAPAFSAELQHEYLGYIVEKSEALEKIIDELLDLGRIETDRTIVLDKQPCDMVAMVKQVLRHYDQKTGLHQFVASCPEGCLDIEIDQAKVQRVFDNLISNAVKYTPRGGITRIEGKVFDSWLEITIADQGIGMTPDQVAMAFDKFYQVDASDTAVRGLGLGLTLSKGIIEAHGGRLWIESEIGQGTRAIFRLPLPERTG